MRWRLLRAFLHAPSVLLSSWVALTVVALLPPPWDWLFPLAVVLAVSVLACGVAEGLAGRVCQANPLAPAQAAAMASALTLLCSRGLGPPRFRLMVRPSRKGLASGTAPFGRRSVVIDQGLVDAARRGMPPEQLAAVIAGAVAGLVAGHTRHDVARAVWTVPWQAGAVLVRSVASLLSWTSPLLRLAWGGRLVVGVIAVGQSVASDHLAGAAAVGGLIAWTYAHPRALARWSRHVADVTDRFVTEQWLGKALASYFDLKKSKPFPL